MLERLAKSQLTSRLSAYTAVTLIGPRKYGKTTLARSLGGDFFDLELEADITRLQSKWDSVIS
jgi:predicted AAA+ superfamily ATPase